MQELGFIKFSREISNTLKYLTLWGPVLPVFPEYRVLYSWAPPWTPFRVCWRSTAVASDFILVSIEPDGEQLLFSCLKYRGPKMSISFHFCQINLLLQAANKIHANSESNFSFSVSGLSGKFHCSPSTASFLLYVLCHFSLNWFKLGHFEVFIGKSYWVPMRVFNIL